MKKKLLKNIEQTALIKSGGATYKPGNGINISQENVISVDTTTIATKEDVANATPQDYDTVKAQVETNKNNIQSLQNKTNTNTQNITTNTSDISSIKNEQTLQDQKIESNRELSNQIIEGLRTLRPFNYVGVYNSETTYQRNQAVDFNGKLFLSKVDGNVGNTPPNGNQSNEFWLLINEVQATIDLSNYYTKNETDNKLQDYLTNESFVDVLTPLESRLENIENKNNEQDLLIEQKASFEYIDQTYEQVLQSTKDYVDTLPSVNYITEGLGEIVEFESESDYELYKRELGVDDSYFEDYNELNISSNETYAGYMLNGKKVYVKFVEEIFTSSVETKTLFSNVDWVVNQNLMGNKWASTTDYTPLPYYYGSITSSTQTYIQLRLTINGDLQIRKSWGDTQMIIKGCVWYTKKGE